MLPWLWVSRPKKSNAPVASGLPLQVETRGAKGGKDVRLLYSDFNSPKIRIDAPK